MIMSKYLRIKFSSEHSGVQNIFQKDMRKKVMEVKMVRTMAIQSEDWRVVSPLLTSSWIFICLELPLQTFGRGQIHNIRQLSVLH